MPSHEEETEKLAAITTSLFGRLLQSLPTDVVAAVAAGLKPKTPEQPVTKLPADWKPETKTQKKDKKKKKK